MIKDGKWLSPAAISEIKVHKTALADSTLPDPLLDLAMRERYDGEKWEGNGRDWMECDWPIWLD